MITIKIEYSVSDSDFERVVKWSNSADFAEFGFGLNGAEATVERDDFTCVECDDEIAGVKILRRVESVLEGECRTDN